VPTLIDLCGVEAPAEVKFDGVSIRPLIENDVAPKDWPDRILVTDSQRVKDPIKWRKSSVMTNDWRLVSDMGRNDIPRHELYAINDDPGQEKNVIDAHPEVAERLKAFYEDWWADIAPSFGDPARIIVGHPAENPSRLTSHDWITDGATPWNQQHIRNGENKPQNLGFWYLDVAESGDYTIELRRWPKEGDVVDTPITAAIPAGKDVPGTQAFRARPGVAVPAQSARIEIGGQKHQTSVPQDAPSVRFDVTLEKGPTRLHAVFEGPGGEITGAYYAYLTKH